MRGLKLAQLEELKKREAELLGKAQMEKQRKEQEEEGALVKLALQEAQSKKSTSSGRFPNHLVHATSLVGFDLLRS